MNRTALTLNAELLLLCERQEQARFLRVYLQYLFLHGLRLPSVQLLQYRSLERLPELLSYISKAEGGGQVRRLAIFADATQDVAERAMLMANAMGTDYALTRERCTHFFFPARQPGKRWRRGYLEDLLLEALRQESAEECQFMNLLNLGREYLVSVNSSRGKDARLKNIGRHLLCAYLAGTERFVGMNLAEAAQAGAFALDAECFEALKRCLSGLADD